MGGTLHFQVVKMCPQPGNASRFYCIGRVFSGTLGADKCVLLQEDYSPPHAEQGVLAGEEPEKEEDAAEEEDEPIDEAEAVAPVKDEGGEEAEEAAEEGDASPVASP